MTFKKASMALAITATLLTGCFESSEDEVISTDVRFGVYNLSFDRATFQDLVSEMTLTQAEQNLLIEGWKSKALSAVEKKRAERVMQIRNVAAVIQVNRPDVLMMAEFNNDGEARDNSAIQGFQDNYLSIPQSLNSIDGGQLREPITYPHFANYATNTGLMSGFDLDRKGGAGSGPDDAWGFGNYHGQYAFALMSRYPIDKGNTRTFQNFKWKDMPDAKNPVIVDCKKPEKVEEPALVCGAEWYDQEAWEQFPLSSKNHVDAPILVPTGYGTKVVHLLMSHPTPPIFNNAANHNYLHNSAELKFWKDYISGKGSYIYDDSGVKGGLGSNESFVILGDLNADPEVGDGDTAVIKDILSSQYVNQDASFGRYMPSSQGAPECLGNGECRAENQATPYPDAPTSTSGLRLDYVIPSSDLNVYDSGVYWPSTVENGRLLMNDKRIGKYGNGKDISSDHRLVWVNARL